jgi:hypothetical protein
MAAFFIAWKTGFLEKNQEKKYIQRFLFNYLF